MAGANFSLANAQLFKGLAQRLPPSALLSVLLPPLLTLTGTAGKRDVQATAAEAIAGLVRGAGVWPLAEQQRLWEALAAPLAAALRTCSVESLGDWQSCIRFCAFNRDPRRIAWLARLLFRSFWDLAHVVPSDLSAEDLGRVIRWH